MICTFYSYKGGVGRSMALANVAELLYQAGYKVLVIDWDLEAPGLERFFFGANNRILDNAGVIDLLQAYKTAMSRELPNNESPHVPNPKEYIINVYPDDHSTNTGQLYLLSAGKRSGENFAKYSDAVLAFDWNDFYSNWEGERYFAWLCSQFDMIADITLIDSRTGVTEMGGVCTYQLADTVIMLCAANDQNFEGTLNIAQNLTSKKMQELRAERPLKLLIVPARIEKAESDRLNAFQEAFISKFRHFAPPIDGFTIEQFWQLAVPYVPKYAYSEELAVQDSEKASTNEIVAVFHKLKQKLEHLRLYQISEQEPSILPRELTRNMARISLHANQSELLELSRLIEKFASKDPVLENVLLYSRGMIDFSLGNYKDADMQFTKIFGENRSKIVLHGIEINKPQRSLEVVEIFEHVGQQLLSDNENFTLQSQHSEEKWLHFDWYKAARAYLDMIFKLYDRVRILGSSADVALGNVFTQVYILDKPTASQRHDLDDLRQRRADRDEFQRQLGKRTPGMKLVQDGQNLFILGKPGAGKTIFLKHVAVQAARNQLPRIPIFISLNQWADSRWGRGENASLLPFLAEQFVICNFPDNKRFVTCLLEEGGALVLFDGLDDVKQDQRRRLIRLLQDFARQYARSQHLITCRIAASDFALAGFTDVEVADFTGEQVREYARKWFGAQEKKFDAFTSELAKADNKGLAELCNTPLLLSLLCLTFDNNMHFPPSRTELYEDALETLLRKWDASREIQRDEIYRELSPKRKLQLLMRIAAPTLEKGELFFRQRDLEQWIVDYLVTLPGAPPAESLDGSAILKAMEAQHSILVERAKGIYSFSHLTFQEYLTARYVTENQDRAVTAKLIHSHLTDQSWREVFILTANLLVDADDFVTTLRSAIDGLVSDRPAVRQLLAWAHDRTQQANAPVERRYAVLLAYIFLAGAGEGAVTLVGTLAPDFAVALAGAGALAPTGAPARASTLTGAGALAPTGAPARASTLAGAGALALAGAGALASTGALVGAGVLAFAGALAGMLAGASALSQVPAPDRESALDRISELARATTPLVGFDYGKHYLWAYASICASQRLDRMDKERQAAMQQLPRLAAGVAALAIESGKTELAHLLATQPAPAVSANSQQWQAYADHLFTILSDERDLGREWNLSEQDIDALNEYFYANELLVQCLKVAVVSDRQGLLDGLLLPPGE